MVTWVVYCPACQKEIDKAPNGALMEAVAKSHADGNGHQVILGFFLDPLTAEDAPDAGTPNMRAAV